MCLKQRRRRPARGGGALALALASCGPAADAPPLSEADVAQRASALVRPLPGLYRSTTRLLDYDLPDAAPADARRLNERMAQLSPQVTTACLDSAQAEAGFAGLAQGLGGGGCSFESFAAGRTRLHARLACASPTGARSLLHLSGRAAARESRLVVRIEQQDRAIAGGSQHLTLEIASRRIGACTGPQGGGAGPAGAAGAIGPFIDDTAPLR